MSTFNCQTGMGDPAAPGPLWWPPKPPVESPSGPTTGRHLRKGRRFGTATVEFAFVAPVLFLVLLGIIEFSRAFMVVHLLTDTAHQGCRMAVVGGQSTSAINTLVTTSLGAKGVSGHTTTVKINGVAGEASAAASGDQIEVSISVPASVVGWLPSQRFVKANLTGHWSLRVE